MNQRLHLTNYCFYSSTFVLCYWHTSDFSIFLQSHFRISCNSIPCLRSTATTIFYFAALFLPCSAPAALPFHMATPCTLVAIQSLTILIFCSSIVRRLSSSTLPLVYCATAPPCSSSPAHASTPPLYHPSTIQLTACSSPSSFP